MNSSASPVEVDVLARYDFANRRVLADRGPNLRLELAGRNIIAKERLTLHTEGAEEVPGVPLWSEGEGDTTIMAVDNPLLFKYSGNSATLTLLSNAVEQDDDSFNVIADHLIDGRAWGWDLDPDEQLSRFWEPCLSVVQSLTGLQGRK